MADGPSYVNVVREKKKKTPKRSQSDVHYYSNPGCASKGECDGYQSVQEHGRNLNGEYTDPNVKVSEDQASSDTLTREQMINELLFPPKKGARRFNYTDIQLFPQSEAGEPVQPVQPVPESAAQTIKKSKKAKPQVMPKPHTLPKMSAHNDDDEDGDSYVEMNINTVEEPKYEPLRKLCTWKCNAIFLLILTLVSISISFAAIIVAAFAVTAQSCELENYSSNCSITIDNGSDRCQTSIIETPTEFKMVIYKS